MFAMRGGIIILVSVLLLAWVSGGETTVQTGTDPGSRLTGDELLLARLASDLVNASLRLSELSDLGMGERLDEISSRIRGVEASLDEIEGRASSSGQGSEDLQAAVTSLRLQCSRIRERIGEIRQKSPLASEEVRGGGLDSLEGLRREMLDDLRGAAEAAGMAAGLLRASVGQLLYAAGSGLDLLARVGSGDAELPASPVGGLAFATLAVMVLIGAATLAIQRRWALGYGGASGLDRLFSLLRLGPRQDEGLEEELSKPFWDPVGGQGLQESPDSLDREYLAMLVRLGYYDEAEGLARKIEGSQAIDEALGVHTSRVSLLVGRTLSRLRAWLSLGRQAVSRLIHR